MKINVEIDGNKYQVLIKDIHARPVVAEVEGEKYEVWPEDAPSPASVAAATTSLIPAEPQVEAAPKLRTDQPGGGKSLTAPLPGVILAVLVKPGERVARGQEICTLEAMKMKNAIKSHRDGTVDSIEVNVGDQVGHGQVLITFTD